MAKITAYADGAPPASGDEFVIARAGANKKIDWDDLYAQVLADILDDLAKPAFEARQTNGNATTCASGAITVVLCDTEDYDPSGLHNPATGRFTPNVAGTYLVTIACAMKALADGTEVWVGIRKNGATTRWVGLANCSAANNNAGAGGTKKIYFNGTTDYVQMVVYHDSGTDEDTYDLDGTEVHWGAHRISSDDISGW